MGRGHTISGCAIPQIMFRLLMMLPEIEMKSIAAATLIILVSLSSAFAGVQPADTFSVGTELPEHGGGCRKSSPPGQCCHMDRKKGSVHCH